MTRRTRHLADEELVLMLDGELDAASVAYAMRHLQECESCRNRCASFEQTSSAFKVLYDAYLPEARASAARLRGAVEQGASARARSRWWVNGTIAASLVLMVGIGLWLRHHTTVDSPDTGVLPIARLTPGAVRAVTVDDICAGRASAPDEIPQHMRRAVLASYQLEHLAPHEYELDYLITPELGGATDPRNLWPERYASSPWNALVKDELEDLLPRLVCQGTITLAVAQRDMAANWIAAYKNYFHTDRPRPRTVATLLRVIDDPRPAATSPAGRR